MTESFTTCSAEESERLGAVLGGRLDAASVVAFYGELGSGKTAMIRGLLASLGVAGPVVSPTFSIVHEYRCKGLMAAHFDLFRLRGPEDLESVGFYDYLGRSLILIEWAERAEGALGEDALKVRITGAGDSPRRVTVETPDRSF